MSESFICAYRTPTRSGIARTLLTITIALALALGVCAAADAAGPAVARLKALPVTGTKVRPRSMTDNETVKVLVRLQSDSVAEARARKPDLTLTADEEQGVVQTERGEHAALRPALEAMGARVISEMHHAINGIAVMTPRNRIADLAALPGVRSVLRVGTYKINNTVSVPFIGAPFVWQGIPGFKGEHIKVGIIDTGIDYTHADFGGPGTPDAYTAAAATDTLPPDPTLVGPNAPKVKGGIDLAGDAYNASDPNNNVPIPDSNPLDCASHGTHVAGTLAGFGVAGGAAYRGPYNAAIYASTTFDVGPGVAPLADIYSIKVFGCAGSTNLAAEAIDWAIANHMDVINMSLGSPFYFPGAAEVAEAENATRAGIIVVAAAGNEGPAPYVVGTPASGPHTLAAAAMDARSQLSGVIVSLSNGTSVNAVQAQLTPFPLPVGTTPLAVLTSGAALSLGCNASDYPPGGTPGALVIVSRGTCLFNQKASLAMQAGAVAIGVVNNTTGYLEPSISGVTIPFLEMLQSDTAKLLAAAGSTSTLAAAMIPNPLFATMATFSSGGPRAIDNVLKPNLTAPGVGIKSALLGSGTQSVAFDGTSMASPHVAGVAALAREAHRGWDAPSVAAAVAETAQPGKLRSYDPRLAGSGALQAPGAVATQVVALGEDDQPSVSFGFDESTFDLHDVQILRLINHGRAPAQFSVSYSPAATVTGVPHTLHLPPMVSVPGEGQVELPIAASVPAATVGLTHDASGNDTYFDVSGVVTLSPRGPANNGVALTVPYYLVPRVRSNVFGFLTAPLSVHHPAASVKLLNFGAKQPGLADFYAWGLYSAPQGDPDVNTRAVGVQSIPFPDGSDVALVFAVNTWSNVPDAEPFQWEVLIDTNGDGQPDYILFTTDASSVGLGNTGQLLSCVFDVNAGFTTQCFFTDAPTNGSTLELPVYASFLGLTASNPTFTYQVQWFTSYNSYLMPGTASFNAFTPSITASGLLFQSIPGNSTVTVPVAIDPVQWSTTPALGVMVVSEDNASGEAQALLLRAH